MLFHVRMDVKLPHDMADSVAANLKQVEKDKAQAAIWVDRLGWLICSVSAAKLKLPN